MINKKFLLKSIIEDTMDNETAIIEILKARGFLIERTEDGYYLSDNATINDADFLEWGFYEYRIGKVVNHKDYVEKSRRAWNELGGSYKYKSLRPNCVKIMINDNASIESAIEFFTCKERIGFEVPNCRRNWVQFLTERFGEKVSVQHLEAYVAFYVKAISACGVNTFFSCDGNHENGGKIYVGAEYPSSIWHFNIWKHIVQPSFGSIPYIGEGIYFDRKNQEKTYLMVYNIAKYLYDNRSTIQWIKELCAKSISKKFRKHHGIDEIEHFYNEECKRVIYEEWVMRRN